MHVRPFVFEVFSSFFLLSYLLTYLGTSSRNLLSLVLDMSLFTRFSPIFRPIEALRTILLILGIITSATAANRLSEDDLDTPSLALRALNVTGSAFVALNTTQPKFSFNYSQFDSPFTGLSYSLSKLCESQYIHYLTQTTSINVATTVRTFFSGEETTVTNSTYPDGTTIVTGQTNFRTFSGPVTGNFPRYFQGHATPPCVSPRDTFSEL